MRIDPKTETSPNTPMNPASDAEVVRATASTVSAAADAVRQVAPAAAGPWLDDMFELGEAADEMGPALALIGHLASDASVATTSYGRVRDAALRTVVDTSVDAGLATTLQSAAGGARSAGLASAGLGLADAVTDDASASGIVVDMARSVDPGTQIAAGAYGLIDGAAVAMNVIRGDLDTATAQSERMQMQAIDGGYGSAGQGLSLAVGTVAGDPVTLSAATDRAAEQGERGVMPMVGNYIGDTWADVAGHHVPESEGRFVDADDYERSTRFASLFGL